MEALEGAEGERQTRIVVAVELPETEAERMDDQREVISRSLARLIEVAAA